MRPGAPLADPRVLVGTWRLERTIDDRLTGEQHEVDGTLRISPHGDELSWEERLVWHRPDGDVDVRRGLRLVPVEDDWWVRFDDGRDFHPWAPGAEVVHPCAPDTYAGRVEGDVRRWTVTWRATGPAKDYVMVSVVTPLGGDPGAGAGDRQPA